MPVPWVLVALCVVLAIAFPLVVRWRATPELLSEQYRLWRPGAVPVLAAAGMVWFGVMLAVAVVTALVHPWAWAAVAMTASVLGSTVLYLVRYRRAAILERQRLRTSGERSDDDATAR